jgi:ferredoxin
LRLLKFCPPSIGGQSQPEDTRQMGTIVIDSYRCSGCATCTEMCPEVFVLNPFTEKAELISSDQEVTDAVRQAAAFCPEKCIVIVEGEETDI